MLRYENLQHSYTSPAGEPRLVLDIPVWSLRAGDQVLLRGVSGSGKTTLFNITAGLLRPTQGTVAFGEQSLYALPESRRDVFRAQHIGYVFQNHHLIPTLSALENVVMPMVFAGVAPSERHIRARDLLDRVGLDKHHDYLPRQLSTGQRLRVAIARALANRPTLLLADEPTAALNADSAVSVMDLIQQTCRESNAILVVASHDPALTERFGIIADLHNGVLTVTTGEAAHV